MRRTAVLSLSCLFLSLLAFSAAGAEPSEGTELKVMTFNVLVEISRKPGVPSWKDRKGVCAQLVREKDPDLLGLQEPTPRQVEFFLEAVPGYTAVVADDFPDAALLYKTEVFEELERGHWWLSPTPEKRSRGFGNFIPRLLVWAKLKHKPTGKEMFVFNTHFDNSMPSQVKMAALCEEKMGPFINTGLPMIFMGDFNTNQKRGDYAKLTSNGWQDSYKVSPHASPNGRDDNVPTMYKDDGVGRIDHIFYQGPGLKPISWERLESPDPNRALSDHHPVLAVFQFQ
jgi:endonuclease/exonuclease/phosphatase family metal-dependent hydrolase